MSVRCLVFWALAVIIALLSLLSTVPLHADEKSEALELVRGRYLAPIQMEGLDASSPEAMAASADLDYSVANLLATQITQAGAPGFGGWDAGMTINSEEISFNGTYFRRTLRLARAWACPASNYYHSTTVATALDRALEYALPMLEAHQRPNNWWAWDIGIPQRLGDTLIIATDAMSPSVRQRAVNEQIYLTKKTQLSADGGANNAWMALVQARTALVADDPTYLDKAAVTMSQLLEVGDAIQPDFSYFFHGDGLNIGYGFSHWDATTRFARVTDDTSWALTSGAQQKLTDWTNEFFVQNAWKGMWSPWTLGRSRTRPYGVQDGMPIMRPTITMDAMSIVRPTLEMVNTSSLPQAQRQALLAMALEHQDGPTSPCDDPSFYYLRENSGVEPTESAYGSHYFPYSDYLTARKPQWYAAVRLNSTRTKTWFTLHGENPLGHEQAEGSLALMTNPDEFGYDVLVTMPWDDLPGVTRQQGLTRIHDTNGEAVKTGGVAIGEYGLASFDYRLSGSGKSLSANKSYLVLPNAVVLMGSDIHTDGSGEVTTTLYTVPKQEGGQLMVDGDDFAWSDSQTTFEGDHWFYLGKVGVVPMETMDHEIAVQTISATSSRINAVYTTDETYTNQFATVRVQHGENPTNGSYAAVLLPAATPEQVADFVAAPTITVLANSAKVHAVAAGGDTTAAAFFDAEQVNGKVWADGPLNLLCRRQADAATIAVMVSPGSTFGQTIARKIWLPGGYDLSQLPDEVVDTHFRNGGTSFTLRLKTGQAFEMNLPVAPVGQELCAIDFDSPYDLSSYFYSLPSGSGGFAHDLAGIGSDGQPGRLTFTSSSGSAPDMAVYDWLPDEQPGPDNLFEDFSVSVDVKFTDDTSASQFFGIAFNIDPNRGDGVSNQDCLILQIRNVDHGGEAVDQWRLRRGNLENADWGDVLLVRDFPSGFVIPQRPDGSGNDWLRLSLDVENNQQGEMDIIARLVDLSTSEIIDSWTLEGLDYTNDLGGAAGIGEIGFLGNDSLGHNSVKIDRFIVQPNLLPGDANEDGTVNDVDASILAAHWQQTGMGWGNGDFNADNIVNDADASILAAHWQESQEGTAPVPEPSTLIGLLALGLAGLVALRRR